MARKSVRVLKGRQRSDLYWCGLCFESSLRWLMERHPGTLVHGTVCVPATPEKRHVHAWVEYNRECFDRAVSPGLARNKLAFYSRYKARAVNRYTKSEALKWFVETKHFGPWPGLQKFLERCQEPDLTDWENPVWGRREPDGGLPRLLLVDARDKNVQTWSGPGGAPPRRVVAPQRPPLSAPLVALLQPGSDL